MRSFVTQGINLSIKKQTFNGNIAFVSVMQVLAHGQCKRLLEENTLIYSIKTA
jgi:hypothetical protein